ncbi:MAG TPA: hypothetical protein VG965_03620 [Patescibacteria group bacterium]|nr:hypothetical protein [Patescibacteria group bacterium]
MTDEIWAMQVKLQGEPMREALEGCTLCLGKGYHFHGSMINRVAICNCRYRVDTMIREMFEILGHTCGYKGKTNTLADEIIVDKNIIAGTCQSCHAIAFTTQTGSRFVNGVLYYVDPADLLKLLAIKKVVAEANDPELRAKLIRRYSSMHASGEEVDIGQDRVARLTCEDFRRIIAATAPLFEAITQNN